MVPRSNSGMVSRNDGFFSASSRTSSSRNGCLLQHAGNFGTNPPAQLARWTVNLSTSRSLSGSRYCKSSRLIESPVDLPVVHRRSHSKGEIAMQIFDEYVCLSFWQVSISFLGSSRRTAPGSSISRQLHFSFARDLTFVPRRSMYNARALPRWSPSALSAQVLPVRRAATSGQSTPWGYESFSSSR